MDNNHFREIAGFEKVDTVNGFERWCDCGWLEDCGFIVVSIDSNIQSNSRDSLFSRWINFEGDLGLVSALVEVLVKFVGDIFRESNKNLILVLEYIGHSFLF